MDRFVVIMGFVQAHKEKIEGRRVADWLVLMIENNHCNI